MSKPRVIIASLNQKNGCVIKKQLADLFSDIIDFGCISKEIGFDCIIRADLVLTTSKIIANDLAKYLMPNTDILVIRRTIHKDAWDKLSSIALGTKALLVNDHQEVTTETISLLYELGLKHLELIPYYPGVKDFPKVEIAITPDEEELVPKDIKTIINIGCRIIDGSSIFEMLSKLYLLDKKASVRVIDHINNIMPRNKGLIEILNNITERKLHLELILDVSNDAIIAFNENEKIIIYNKKAQDFFKMDSWKVLGKTLREFFCEKQLENLCVMQKVEEEVFNINEHLFVANKYPLREAEKYLGGIITFKKCDEIQRLEFKFRQNIKKKGHIAKYSIEDIIGKSDKMQNLVSKAKRFACSDCSVIIQGESGTGKELFAQAIHNLSNRKDKSFVAFNCASLTDSLIESELFGYAQGAFTGAKKDGKPGLFELAHQGTMFLDEIGDISLNVQARLLRVLQEKEVIRVGGTKIIPVDIRIVAATNKNLMKLVKEEKFRLDLFYRLNILPLNIPPLRERKEDILYLTDYFLEKKGVKRDISKEVMGIFMGYDWPGNIRELDNFIEYMINTNSKNFGIKDLPSFHFDNISKRLANERPEVNISDEQIFILKILKQANENAEKIGRKTIGKRLEKFGIYLTEQEIRTRLKKLKEKNLIIVGKGRAATKISARGKACILDK